MFPRCTKRAVDSFFTIIFVFHFLSRTLTFIYQFFLLQIFWLALFSTHFCGTLSVLFGVRLWANEVLLWTLYSSSLQGLLICFGFVFSLHFLAWFRFSCSMSIQHLPRVLWWVTLLYVVFPSVSYTSKKPSYLLHSKDTNFYQHLHGTLWNTLANENLICFSSSWYVLVLTFCVFVWCSCLSSRHAFLGTF